MNTAPGSRPWLIRGLFLLALLAVVIVYFLLVRCDPFYRTIFVEEMNSGEAGRAMALFGEWQGEGGRWQSAPVVPAGTALNWLAFELGGMDKLSLRYTYAAFAIAGLVLMQRVLRQTAPDRPYMALMAFLALAFSPLMLHVLPSALNETLFLFCVALPMALATLGGGLGNWRRKHAGMIVLAAASALPVLVKLDGAIIPLAVSVAVLFAWRGGDLRLSHVAAFFATGIVAALVLGVSTYIWLGTERLADMRLLVAEMSASNPNLTPDLKTRIIRTFVWFPRNLEMYLPGASLVVAFAVTIAVSRFRQLTFASRIALFVLVGYFLLSLSFPLVYWKRVLLIVPCVIVVLLAATQTVTTASRRLYVVMGIGAALSVIWGTVAMASRFQGMWRIEAAWELDSWPVVAAAGLLGAVVCAGLCFFGWHRRLINAAYCLICLATIGSGGWELSRERTIRASEIGHELSAYLDGSTVVSDHQAFRFFGYYTDARVRFTHENDPDFPERVLEDARALSPDYVVVTDAYRFPYETFLDDGENYRLVATYSYTFPASAFLSTPYTTNLYVFAKVSG